MSKNRDLEQNELADRLEHGIQSISPMLPFVLGGIVLLIVGSVGWGIYSNSKRRAESAAWTEFYFNMSGGDPDTFLDVSEGFPDSAMSGWAKQAAGDSYLQRGIDELYRNRKTGEENIQLAIETFEKVEADAESEELRSKALLGLAKAYESLGNLDKANEYYESLTKVDVSPQLLNAVNDRIAFINSTGGKDFYDWFSKLDPKPDAPIQLPSNLSLPPTTPDLSFGDNPPPLPTDAMAPQGDAKGEVDSGSLLDIELPNATESGSSGATPEAADASTPAGGVESPKDSESSEAAEAAGSTEDGKPAVEAASKDD